MFLCPPAFIYLIFCLIQIILDMVNGLYNTAFMKTIVAVIVTFLLNVLCQLNLGIISWIIVFIPFMFMTVITTMLLYIFGLDVATGTKITTTTYSNNDKEELLEKQTTTPVNTYRSSITSPPYAPWLLPNNPVNNSDYLMITGSNEKVNIVNTQQPNKTTIIPIKHI